MTRSFHDGEGKGEGKRKRKRERTGDDVMIRVRVRLKRSLSKALQKQDKHQFLVLTSELQHIHKGERAAVLHNQDVNQAHGQGVDWGLG